MFGANPFFQAKDWEVKDATEKWKLSPHPVSAVGAVEVLVLACLNCWRIKFSVTKDLNVLSTAQADLGTTEGPVNRRGHIKIS